ncbi:hypothetical protein GUITHDRAFT_111402 [Guillardia theta CCMP2712]|uniref:Uncharacterized protein n=1 Tax=Guillardia theta (strain CCMP2712) TaxID=905079 RepID=L1J3R3_GUITC|nr:hypothetical protein GUITHDRAFT_111402 [Guillardia theta CCMP2712]EKX42730.1 hypothetical protein GUITHDRAFT_111402 [Guillardia theta CCMP2712]|eukprot:XP_005829710.1 hypothetical protein GUITHDRAFT_111402 [Guillardia theta CCMP2712]
MPLQRIGSAKDDRTSEAEEEQHISMQMTEWLSTLPASMPVHRGQVLIIPQSPYRQNQTENNLMKKKQVVPNLSRLDVVELDCNDEEIHPSGAAAHSKQGNKGEEEEASYGQESLVYVSPTERRLRRECEQLNEFLQRSQTELMKVKTKRHRYLDSDRMNRSELMQTKYLFGHKRAEAKDDQPRSMQAESWSSTRGQMPYMLNSSDLERKQMSQNTTVSQKRTGSLRSSTLETPRIARTPYSDENKQRFFTPRPPSAAKSVTESPLAKSLRFDRTATASPYSLRLRFVSSPGAKTETVLSKSALSSGKEEVRTDEHRQHEAPADNSSRPLSAGARAQEVNLTREKISLENFEDYPERNINSPHSVLAMKRFGVLQEDILPRPLEYYRDLDMNSSLHSKASPRKDKLDPMFLIQLRMEFDEKKHSKRRPPELKAFGAAARQNYIAEPSANTHRVHARGIASYSEDLATTLSERSRIKSRKLHQLERRRMQTAIRKQIQLKDKVDELQEKLVSKFSNRVNQIELKKRKLRENRERKEIEHYQRSSVMKAERDRLFELKKAKMIEKNDTAEILHQEAVEQVRKRLQLKAEIDNIKQEHQIKMMKMAERASLYKRQLVEEKLARAQETSIKMMKQREQIVSERLKMKQMVMEEREYVNELVESFQTTGKFKKSADGQESQVVKEVLNLDTDSLPIDFVDRNRKARLLENQKPFLDSVAKGDYRYYKFRHRVTKGRITVLLKTKKGDPDLFIGNNQCPFPTKQKNVWKKSEFGDDKIILHPFDQGFVVGYIYIGVFGFTDAEYAISLKWKSSDEKDFRKFERTTMKQAHKIAEEGEVEEEEEDKDGNKNIVDMGWQEVVELMEMLNIDESVREVVRQERVPGSQIRAMSLDELMQDLNMSKLQAKRLLMTMDEQSADASVCT